MDIPLQNAAEPVRIVQFTDSHLTAQEGGELLGMNTDVSLDHVLRLISEQQTDSDLILATGDLADGGSHGAYERLQDKLKAFCCPDVWLTGNHDLRDVMAQVVSPSQLSRVVNVGDWQLIMLDSTIPYQVDGELGRQELAFLERCLARREARHYLVCLHHQPVPVGCEWLDTQQISDADDFFKIIDQYPSVRCILWGHVHQEFDQVRKGVRLMASPSTCVQFAPNNADFKVDRLLPGYRWLNLYPDGRIVTGVSRLQGIELAVDYDSQGY